MTDLAACKRCFTLVDPETHVCTGCGAAIVAEPRQWKPESFVRFYSPDEMREINAGRLIGAELQAATERARMKAARAATETPVESVPLPLAPPDPLRCQSCRELLTPRDAFEFEFHFRSGIERDDRSGDRGEHEPGPAHKWEGMNVVVRGEKNAAIEERMRSDPEFLTRMQEDGRLARRIRAQALLTELGLALGERITKALSLPCPKCGAADPLKIA